MGILNLTHDDHGSALQRLPVGIKLAIGEPPAADDPKGHPKRLDHFVFKRRGQKGQDVIWEAAEDIASVYGTNPREVGIIFMDDDIENVLRTNYAWWSQTECKCSGELVQVENGNGPKFAMQAIRKTQRCPDGESWPGVYKYTEGPKKGQPAEPCGDGCPDLEAGRCKPNGALYFNLDRFPMVGAIASIRTTSYRSIRNLSNGLMQIQKITGGRLAGIRVMLRAEPEKISFESSDGKKRTSIAHILSLRIDATDMKVLLENMTETAKLFAQTKLLGGGGRPVQYLVEDSEKEKAIEMSGEFYPEVVREEKSSTLPKANIPPLDVDPLEPRVIELCKELGINTAKMHMMMGQYAGKYADLVAKLESDLKSNRPAEGADAQRKESQPTKSQTPASQPPQSASKVSASFDF